MSATKTQSVTSSRTLMRLRLSSLAALGLYPIGASLKLAYSGAALSAPALVGGALVALGVIGWVMVLASAYYRITFVGAPDLDEREIAERADAFQCAYIGLGLLAVVGVFYLMMADLAEEGWSAALWTPDSSGDWRAILFGVLIYVMVLPASMLIWRARPLGDD